MTRLLTACMLALLCLLRLPASSQPHPHSFREGLGVVCLDTATYRQTRQYVAAAGQLLLVRADRIAALERSGQLADSMQVAYAAELRRCRASQAATEADYLRMQQAARVALASPPRPPWLLDSHTYKGVGAGVVLAVLLKVFVFH